jgi:hypothetical protein
MLADHWVIAQIIGQVSSFFLILIALLHSATIIHNWDPASASEKQLLLERKTYLVSTLIKYVLIFQVVSLILFLVTANNHLPGLIKGAMCATGTLSVNSYGYPYLYLKNFSVIVYIVFLFINYLDQSEPEYPLTPLKFWFIPLIFLLISADLVLLLFYFLNIEPDIIATCCSISFSVSNRLDKGVLSGGSIVDWLIPVFYFIAVLIAAAIYKKKDLLAFFLSLVFIPVAVYLLKYHYVKFIYALPTHNCLFDIFWKDYFYIGYILFGALFIIPVALILNLLINFFQQKLSKNYFTLSKHLRYTALTSTISYVMLVSGYWIYWIVFRL